MENRRTDQKLNFKYQVLHSLYKTIYNKYNRINKCAPTKKVNHQNVFNLQELLICHRRQRIVNVISHGAIVVVIVVVVIIVVVVLIMHGLRMQLRKVFHESRQGNETENGKKTICDEIRDARR